MPELAAKPLFELANGRYVALEVLGRGGNSTVYRCLDRRAGMQRAVKVRLPGRGIDKRALTKRLDAEAAITARIDHPRLLPVHDHGVDGSMHFVVMSLADGGSLAGHLEAHGRMGPARAARLMAQVLEAVQAAHEAGVVHRDLKPDNILLDARGDPLLADFGIAKVRRDDTPTFSGATLGSLAYMAPEQRVNASQVGPAADVYSAGATLFHLLTLSSPVDLFACPANSPRWEGVPTGIRDALHKACAYRPEERYASAKDFASDLLRMLPMLPVHPLPTADERIAPAGDTETSAPRRITTPYKRARSHHGAPGSRPGAETPGASDQPPAQERWAVPIMLGASAALLAIIAIALYYLSAV